MADYLRVNLYIELLVNIFLFFGIMKVELLESREIHFINNHI